MKTQVSRLICLLVVAMPMLATAQSNIQSAFDAIIKCPDAQIIASHSLEKDPATKLKTGQSDIYRFTLPDKKIDLVKKVISAFDKDSQMAYSINSGRTAKNDEEIVVAVGDATGAGVQITDPESDYVYALFLAPQSEDKTGTYRYAYSINYKEANGKITGKLVVTYATTLKSRQEQEQHRQLKVLQGFSNEYSALSKDYSVISIADSAEQPTWFDKLMSYFQGMTSANTQTRIALATQAYKLISNIPQYQDVTDQDKDAAREVLKGMISDPKYSESVLNRLLNQCLIGIK